LVLTSQRCALDRQDGIFVTRTTVVTTVTTEYKINKIIANDFKARAINPETDTYTPIPVTSRNLACMAWHGMD
jgi:hypothetical protein